MMILLLRLGLFEEPSVEEAEEPEPGISRKAIPGLRGDPPS